MIVIKLGDTIIDGRGFSYILGNCTICDKGHIIPIAANRMCRSQESRLDCLYLNYEKVDLKPKSKFKRGKKNDKI